MQTEITTEQLLEGFRYELEVTARPRTVEYYCGELRRFLRWADSVGIPSNIRLITKNHIQRFFHYLAATHGGTGSGNEPERVERVRWPYYRALRRFFAWAVKEGYLEHNPMDGVVVKRPQSAPIEPYLPEHIERMLRVIEHDWQVAKTPRQRMRAARDRAILLLFVESGLRLEELAKLRLGDIDLERRRVRVWFGKLGKSRLSGFGPQTKKALWRYLSLRPSEVAGDALWATEEGTSLSVSGVQMIVRRLKKDAGLQHLRGSIHKLRHTFATSYLRQTRDMKGCRLLLGHATLDMTERYTQFIDEEDALRAYDGKGPMDWLRGQ